MKSVVIAVAAASALSIPLAAFSQSDPTLTRAQVRAELQQIEQAGYDPAKSADGDIELRNRPFRQLARQYPELVCSLNLQLIQGMLEATGDRPARGVLAPREGGCCVVAGAPERPRRKRVSRAAKTPPRPTRNTAP